MAYAKVEHCYSPQGFSPCAGCGKRFTTTWKRGQAYVFETWHVDTPALAHLHYHKECIPCG